MRISNKTVKNALKASYQKNAKLDGYKLDSSLSGKRVKVFYNEKSGKSIVSHRGTASATDWVKTNLPMAFGYERGKRFKHAKKIQKLAENKYGNHNVTTVGHSLGGRIAEKVGGKSSQIITYNKAATLKSISKKTKNNQTDIRTTRDPVSFLSRYQTKSNPSILIKSNSFNFLREHSVDALKFKNRLN